MEVEDNNNNTNNNNKNHNSNKKPITTSTTKVHKYRTLTISIPGGEQSEVWGVGRAPPRLVRVVAGAVQSAKP